MVEPYFANTPLLEALKKRNSNNEGEYKESIDTALAVTQYVKLLPPEKIVSAICDCLFSSSCPTRTPVAFWHDKILLFCLCKLFPDKWTDFIFDWATRTAGK